MTSSSNRRGAAKTTLPWTTTEEITLCTAWCNAMDTYVTRDIHSRKGFWEEVFANFEKDMGGTIRGYDVIVSKWKNSICPKVVVFSVVYDGVQRMDKNGSSDLVLFQNALAEYQTRYYFNRSWIGAAKSTLHGPKRKEITLRTIRGYDLFIRLEMGKSIWSKRVAVFSVVYDVSNGLRQNGSYDHSFCLQYALDEYSKSTVDIPS
ncbi:hypothetical protein Tco_0712335 [Tanacetum coccineum]